MNETTGTLGDRLKSARESRGLSAQKAADELHLDGWVIEALESGDYARIGPSVYGKGHLKRYAGLLGLSAADVIDAYDARSAPPAPAAAQASSLRMRTDTPIARKALWLVVGGVGLAVLAAAGLARWQPWRAARVAALGEHSAAAAIPAASALPAAATGSETDAADVLTERPVDQTATATTTGTAAMPASGKVASAANDTQDTPAGSGHARLRLSFSADSWVDVHDAAGRRLFAGKGRANSVKSLAGDAPMKIYLGFASGVQLEVNNHVVAIGPQFLAGDVARFEAGADGVLRRDVAAPVAGNARPRG